MKTQTHTQQEALSCNEPKTQNWAAWLNTMPPKPDDFHVTGEVEVSNPGVLAILVKKNPQGINKEILLLDLYLVQQPGIWPQIISTAQARYDAVIPANGTAYKEVHIFCGEKIIEKLEVQVVS